MKGIWYSSNGRGCEHWHEYILKPDGTGFWAAISRCGMCRVVPSMLEDKFNKHITRVEGHHCRSCLKQKEKDESQRTS